jgi:hypothetical protein
MALDSSIALDYRFLDLSESDNNYNFTICTWSYYLSTYKKTELKISLIKNNL